ncbi:MAG: MFS transporter [Micromonosporaceae bacterium]
MTIRRLVLVSCALMVCQSALFIVRPMTSYRILALGQGSVEVGVVSATFALAPLLLAVPFGRIAGDRRAGVVAIAGSAVMTLGCVGHALMRTVAEAITASVVLGVGHIAVVISLQMVIAGESPEREYDRNFAWFTVGASVGQLLGPMAGTAVLASAGEPIRGTTLAMLLAAGAAAVVMLLGVPLLPRRGGPSAGVTRGENAGAKDAIRNVVSVRGAPSALYVGLVVLSCVDLLTAYLPVLGEEIGLAPFIVGVLLAVRAGASIASRVLIGSLSRMSRTAVLIGSACVAAVCLVALTTTAEVWALVLVMAVLGFALGFGQPLTMSWLVLLVPATSRGDALALRLIGNRLGQVAGPSAAAAFSGLAGSRSVFWMMGGLLASSAWLVQRFRRDDRADGRDSAP